jgi:Tfp pilus assembly protein PilO
MMDRMNGLVGVIASSVAVLLVVLVGWFVFVSPQRSKADKVDAQLSAAKAEFAADQALLAAPRRNATEAALGAAKRALPADPQVSQILRQLDGFAKSSRTEIDNITPGTPLPVASGQAVPITFTFKGRYFGLQKLLKLLRQSADVKKGKLVATGRLYTVDNITFNTTDAGSDITAQVALNAFVYTGAPAPTASPTTTTETSSAAAAP